ncbi:MAG TPA: hypothetical protein VI197_23460, partial [Polyangiaceae bacterium]
YSLHMVGGDTLSQVLLFVLAGVFASMLLVGYRTRLASVVSWILLCSLQNRNTLVLHAGDDLLRLMLFWSMFVPLGARWSVDAAAGDRVPGRAGASRSLLSLGTLALVMQLLSMYLISAALQSGPSWHRDGSALQLVLGHHAFVTAFGQWFRQLPPHVLQGLTWQLWWLERCGPLLFFVPWNTYWWRTLAVLAFTGLNLWLFLTLELGLLPWVAMVYWLAILPSWFWDGPAYRLCVRAGVLGKLRTLAQGTQAFCARQRKWLGPLRSPGRIRPTWIGSVVVLVLASVAGYGSAHAMTHGGSLTAPRFAPLLMTGLSANWGLFAPDPPTTSGWLVSVAKQKSGEEIDVWNDGRSVSFDQPELPSATYRRSRWRKLADTMASEDHAGVRSHFARWLCREWNEDHTGLQRVQSITLYQMAQTANFDGTGNASVSKHQLARENCPATP